MAAPVISAADGPPSASATVSPTDVDKRYKITLNVGGDDAIAADGSNLFPMYAAIPEKFSLSMSSNWDTPFNKMNDALEGKLSGGGSTLQTILAGLQATGQTVKFKQASAQVWQNSTPMTFSIPFVFAAVNDEKTDVAAKLKALLKLVAPSEWPKGSGHLVAPGPTLLGTALSSRIVSVQIGTFLKMSPAIVRDVQCDFDAIFGQSGAPMFASANVTVESFYTSFTTEDLDSMFLV